MAFQARVARQPTNAMSPMAAIAIVVGSGILMNSSPRTSLNPPEPMSVVTPVVVSILKRDCLAPYSEPSVSKAMLWIEKSPPTAAFTSVACPVVVLMVTKP